MNTLHIFNKLPSIEPATAWLTLDSSILLIEDAVLASLKPTIKKLKLDPWVNNKRLLVLENDALARGMRKEQLTHVQLIDYAGFVDLVAKHSKSVSW